MAVELGDLRNAAYIDPSGSPFGAGLRYDALEAMAKVAEGHGEFYEDALIESPEAHTVATVLMDPFRRMSIFGARVGMPRSLGSVFGGSVMRYLDHDAKLLPGHMLCRVKGPRNQLPEVQLWSNGRGLFHLEHYEPILHSVSFETGSTQTLRLVSVGSRLHFDCTYEGKAVVFKTYGGFDVQAHFVHIASGTIVNLGYRRQPLALINATTVLLANRTALEADDVVYVATLQIDGSGRAVLTEKQLQTPDVFLGGNFGQAKQWSGRVCGDFVVLTNNRSKVLRTQVAALLSLEHGQNLPVEVFELPGVRDGTCQIVNETLAYHKEFTTQGDGRATLWDLKTLTSRYISPSKTHAEYVGNVCNCFDVIKGEVSVFVHFDKRARAGAGASLGAGSGSGSGSAYGFAERELHRMHTAEGGRNKRRARARSRRPQSRARSRAWSRARSRSRSRRARSRRSRRVRSRSRNHASRKKRS